ncbi:SAG-related sequence SRS40F [Toxoplasma gondii FOU]|uniref:SAG-related sequence SRS40F n=3 Tax=Toxoplasma gondii TaxID=5811 RepID=A0A086LEG1_TOXGO|nr:SAG-related sequence SRS40F [Toxoplasma gondii FOU]PUA91313.1 SAG-related sequence SRS40F [Toxoplasma gondii TgCATBr9]RQX74668.1 SAG-related sequence SRS40F [Toxoplasma gondii CAST]
MARTARVEQRRGGFKSKARKFVAVCVGGVLLLSGGQAAADYLREGAAQRSLEALQEDATHTGPVFSGQTASCTLTGDTRRAQAQAATSLTLSKEKLTITLRCSGANNQAVPKDMQQVCSETSGEATVAKCKDANGKRITLQSLLGSSPEAVWKKSNTTTEDKNNGEEWTLELKESDLPLTDKAFFVGCDKSTASGTRPEASVKETSAECKVDVNVKARPSSVADDNVVTCAYGNESNPEPLKVEMTTVKNTLTIQCGSQGSLRPTTFKTQYCDPQEALENCTEKKFEEILPAFVTSWWSEGADKTSVKLKIPETDFPQSEQQFRVQCIPKDTVADPPTIQGKNEDDTETAARMSACNVIVTVMAGSSASSSGQMVATATGAAALTGLFIGLL